MAKFKSLSNFGFEDWYLKLVNGFSSKTGASVAYHEVLNNMNSFINNVAKNNVKLNNVEKGLFNVLTKNDNKTKQQVFFIMEDIAGSKAAYKNKTLQFEYMIDNLTRQEVDMIIGTKLESIADRKAADVIWVEYKWYSVPGKTVDQPTFVKGFISRDLANRPDLSKLLYKIKDNPLDYATFSRYLNSGEAAVELKEIPQVVFRAVFNLPELANGRIYSKLLIVEKYRDYFLNTTNGLNNFLKIFK